MIGHCFERLGYFFDSWDWPRGSESLMRPNGQARWISSVLNKDAARTACTAKLCQKPCLSAHETGRGKSTSMSLHSGLGGRKYRKRELDFPRTFTPVKIRTKDKSTNLELLRKFPTSFALHVVLKELLWLRFEFACVLRAAKETKGNYGCVEIITVKRKKEILIAVLKLSYTSK